jgi:3-oxoacyl-[acyl-carrier protein] reductase
MSDLYAGFAASAPGRLLVKQLGLPNPPKLRRHHAGARLLPGPILLGGDGRVTAALRTSLDGLGADIRKPEADEPVAGAYGALIFDATGITSPDDLEQLYAFFHPYARALMPCGRVIVIGSPTASTPAEGAAQRALDGFTRSVGKEFGRGITSHLLLVAGGAEDRIDSTLAFLLSGKSAYVSGQTITIDATVAAEASPADPEKPLTNRVALVTGAARGIGAAIAEVLARDGATVICLDLPTTGDALASVANAVGGSAIQLDLTTSDAPAKIVDFVASRFGGLDIVVHNAGITRDKTIANMRADQWQSVLDVNLRAPMRLNAALLEAGMIRAGGRIIEVSSISGIAGNRGQTNYATSKAGVIGVVHAYAPELAARGITINAVAPGFIETEMTARMPMFLREAGRRMNSLSQAGLPIDVAETIAWFAAPGSSGVTGNVVRVCGQSLLGA